MASAAKANASAKAVAKVQAAARKAGHACNEHDARFIGYSLDEAIARRLNVKHVHMEYGALRVRFDLRDDGGLEVVEEKDVEHKRDGLPADKGQASPSEPARPPFALPGKATPKISELSPDDLRKRVEKAAEKRRRQKAARKKREEAKREQAAKYVVQPYGSDGAAIVTVNCPLWSTRMDLKTAFVRLVAEVTERMSLNARNKGISSRGASARFGGSDYQVSVLDGTLAAFVEADELAEDLLVLLADGLTEERLVALLTRWSKAWRRKPSGGAKEMDQLD